MEYNHIKQLLDKYLEGESSLEEEQELAVYFLNTKDIPQEFAFAKAMFCQFKQEKEVTYPRRRTRRSIILKLSAVAASIAIVIGLGFYLPKQDQPIYGYINGEPIRDKAVAISEIESALSMVSKNYNRGTEELDQLTKFNEATDLFIKK